MAVNKTQTSTLNIDHTYITILKPAIGSLHNIHNEPVSAAALLLAQHYAPHLDAAASATS